MPTLTMFIQNGIEKPSYSNQTEKKRNFENSVWKEKSKTVSACRCDATIQKT